MPYKKKSLEPIYLIGYRCTGKTTTGKLLARLLDKPFIDTDREVETRFSTTIEEMVAANGWEYFRQKEKKVLQSLSFTGDNSFSPVVATGGGIILDPENREFLKTKGICIWLYADNATIVERLGTDSRNSASRPKLTRDNLSDETCKMLELRTPLYSELARIKIDTAGLSPEEAAQMIKRRIFNGRF